jgi:hypothetical protein
VGRLEDVRLGLFGKADDLGIAAALDVEDPLVGPGVLVVADEEAVLPVSGSTFAAECSERMPSSGR